MPPRAFHKPTVEDETDGADSTAAPTLASTVAEVSKPAAEEASTPKARGPRDTANLNDGILTIRVPKAPKHEARRININ
ncbi:hypothetical protein HYQ46_009893 [Verticillium longisporum]|nr:hypothetical protein HYQ44_014841 [Verticillium longisporum]KAG7130493.1 hypothetical protein HYQ46_009893 [Verticillium longisporum]